MMFANAFPFTSSMVGTSHDIEHSDTQHEKQQDQQSRKQKRPSAPLKEKRRHPGTPDPDAEVIALSPGTLMATNRFACEVCGKGFQREQNLQLHRRGHNLPWKLKRRMGLEVARKRVYVCPEITCVHHDPSRALGDLTGIKKHYSRKHGEKKLKCEKCSKTYAVKCDWKAHMKVCGTREYKCDCGTIFSRKDSYINHRAFCEALMMESARLSSSMVATTTVDADVGFKIGGYNCNQEMDLSSGVDLSANVPGFFPVLNPCYEPENAASMSLTQLLQMRPREYTNLCHITDCGDYSAPQQQTDVSLSTSDLTACGLGTEGQQLFEGYTQNGGAAHLSATALLQKAAQACASTSNNSPFLPSTSSCSLFLGGLGGLTNSIEGFNYDNGNRNDQPQVLGFNYSNENENDQPQVLNQGMQIGTFPYPVEMVGARENPMTLTDDGVNATTTMMAANPEHYQPIVTPSEVPNPWEHEGENNLTRDFLGLGSVEATQPSLQQELANFISMVPEIDLSGASFDGIH